MAEEDRKEEENIGSFYIGRTRPPPVPKRLLPPGVLTLVALAALGGIIWYAYPRGAERYTNLDVPVVKADTAPIKAKPASPGGMEVSHQDSTVFDPLQKNGTAEVEKLTPAPEQPMDKDQALKAEETIKPIAASPNLPPKLDMQVKQAANGAEEIIPNAAATPPVAPPVPQPAPNPVPTPVPAKIAAAPEKMAAPAAAPQPPVARPAPVAKPATKPDVKPAPAVKKEAPRKAVPKKEAVREKPKAEKSPKPAAGANYEVQLGSYREETDAKKDWLRLQKKYAAQLSGLKMRLEKADIPGKGIYYRMKAGVISKDKAHDICHALKGDRGVGCFVEKK